MLLRRTSLLLSATALLLVAPPATAALPGGSKVIVPGTSIGGVKIGMPAEAARTKWGTGGTCDEAIDDTCRYADGAGASLAFEVADGKVSLVSIRVATDDRGNPRFRGAILSWKTAKKIRIGSPTRAVRKAYPKAKPSPSGLALGSGARQTVFATSGGRVTEIFIGRLP